MTAVCLRAPRGGEDKERLTADLTVVGAETGYIGPGSSWGNSYIESFDAGCRMNCSRKEVFYLLREAQLVTESWCRHYNTDAHTPRSASGRPLDHPVGADHRCDTKLADRPSPLASTYRMTQKSSARYTIAILVQEGWMDRVVSIRRMIEEGEQADLFSPYVVSKKPWDLAARREAKAAGRATAAKFDPKSRFSDLRIERVGGGRAGRQGLHPLAAARQMDKFVHGPEAKRPGS